MSKGSIFDHDWIDLVFEGRNQKYGAYQLRRQDSKTTMLALVSGIALMGVLVGIPAIANHFKNDSTASKMVNENEGIVVVELPATPPELPKPEPPVQSAAAAPADPQPTQRFTTPEPTPGPADPEIPTTRQVQQTNPGQATTPGTGENNFNTGAPTGTGTPGSTGTATTGSGTEDGPLTPAMLDKSPEFPGGLQKFYDYVGNNFKTPESETAGAIKVYVSFIIETDGSMTNIKVPRDPGYGMATEAVRVLKSLKTKWKPGIKNGKAVRTMYNLPITVQLK